MASYRDIDYIKSIVAKPKNTKNPIISVAVVTKIELAIAGSIFTDFRIKGTSAPKSPATNRLVIIAIPKTSPSMGGAWKNVATTAATMPTMTPFKSPAIDSFTMMIRASAQLIS